jgi:hypothetical protein
MMSAAANWRAAAQNRSFQPILGEVTSQSTSQGLERAANLCPPNVRAALSLLSVLSRNVRGQNGSVFHFSPSPLASARILSTGTAEALLTPAEDFRNGDTSGIFRRLHGAESTIAKPALPLGNARGLYRIAVYC